MRNPESDATKNDHKNKNDQKQFRIQTYTQGKQLKVFQKLTNFALSNGICIAA